MHCQQECYSCLEGLARRCASLAAARGEKQDKAFNAALSFLEQHFSLDSVSIGPAGEMQRIIRSITGNDDPFAAVKEEEMALARHYAEKYAPGAAAPLPELVQFAARGNGFDFFQDLQRLEKQLQLPVKFARSDTPLLEEMLLRCSTRGGKKLLYLADNAGECYFDLPLVRALDRYGTVYYGVKESPVQNDLAAGDLMKSGIGGQFRNIVSTGTDSPGLDLEAASPSFLKLMKDSDLIVAKGMGHYETLTELSLPQPIFMIFQVKCLPVSRDSGLPLHSYAAYFLDGADHHKEQ
jgi:uncharacterized protein with ATP-grasp and redox domains